MKLKRTMLLATSVTALAIGYKNDTGWKKDDDGNLVTDSEGNPIFIDGEGKDTTIAPGYINRLNTEAASHRTRANEAEKALKAFEGLDAKAARDALKKLEDVDLNEMVAKGELENVRTQLRTQFEEEIRERDEKLTERDKKIETLALDNAFNSSDFLKTRLALPVDAARATFRDRFKVEDGKVVPLDNNGERLINKHGDTASVDEAFEHFISGRPDAEQWIKAPEQGGSGSGGAGGNNGTGNKMKRSAFDALDPAKQSEIGQKASKGEIQIVDD